jgi:hypothetical protein
MTNKRTDNGKGKGKDKDKGRSRFLRNDKTKEQTTAKEDRGCKKN